MSVIYTYILWISYRMFDFNNFNEWNVIKWIFPNWLILYYVFRFVGIRNSNPDSSSKIGDGRWIQERHEIEMGLVENRVPINQLVHSHYPHQMAIRGYNMTIYRYIWYNYPIFRHTHLEIIWNLWFPHISLDLTDHDASGRAARRAHSNGGHPHIEMTSRENQL